MTEQNRTRPVIDLDELERQLREASAPRPVAPAGVPGRDDPLAELARIVGQDDPYRSASRTVVAPRPVAPSPVAPPPMAPPPAAPAPSPRFEPSDFEAELAALSRGEPFVPSQPAPAPYSAPAPSFEPAMAAEAPSAPEPMPAWSLRAPARDDRFQPAAPAQPAAPRDAQDVEPQSELEPVYGPEGQLPPHQAPYVDAPRKSRRGLYAVMVVMGVAVVGVSAGFAVKNTLSSSTTVASGGLPPVIKAEAGPMKVQPENPGGVVVPNQDRQIYNKGTPEDTKGAKMVGGEEQPVDVNQLARQQPKPPAPTSGTSTTAGMAVAPPATSVELPKPPQTTALPGLGEPRKVRTVSVRPDGTIIESDGAPLPARTASLAPVVPSTPEPANVSSTTGAVPAPPNRPRSATPDAGATPAAPAANRPTPTSTAATAPAAPVAVAAPKPATPKPTQLASTQPVAPVETTETASGGGFAVQLAAPPSEQEARDAASRLGKRFAGELGDLKPVIRKAEVNGKTIYRVRVGSLSRDDATALCEKLKAAGGQCFIAKN